MNDEDIRQVREQLESGDPRTRVHALFTLGRRGDREALPRIVALLHDNDYRVRVEALHAVGKLGYREALPVVVELLHDREMPVRGAAAATLGALGDPLAVEPLIECLSDRNEHPSYEAVVALAEIGDPRMRDAFIHRLLGRQAGASPRVLERIIETLTAFRDPEVVDALIQTLRYPDDGVRAKAAKALGTIGDPRALPPLEYMAANDDGEYWEEDGDTLDFVAAEGAIEAIIAQHAGQDQEGTKRPGAGKIWKHRMQDYAACRKVFVDHRTWYAEDFPREGDPVGLLDRIELQFYRPKVGLLGTITVEWYKAARPKLEDPLPVLRIPWAAWGALAHCGDLLARISQISQPAIQPDEFRAILKECGFADRSGEVS